MRKFDSQSLSKLKPHLTDAEKTTLLMYDGDHWLEGNGWVGPRLESGHLEAARMMNEVKTMFVSQNVLAEVVDRQVAGLIGIPPDWSITVKRVLAEDEEPTTEEEVLIERAENILRRWWEGQQGLVSAEDQLWSPYKILRRALATGLMIKRAPLRIFIPADRWLPDAQAGDPVLAEDAGNPAEVQLPRLQEQDAIESVYLHLPDPAQAEVHIDHNTLRVIGVYVIKADGGVPDYELYSLENGRALLHTYSNGELQSTMELDLQNHALMFEIGLSAIIDDSMLRHQRLLNMTLTMMGRNVVIGGFLERIVLNGQLPGKEYIDPDTGERTFVPEPFDVGAGKTSFVAGVEYQDADGSRRVANPSVVYRDPVNTETFIKSASFLYRNMLHEVFQEHILMSDNDASGESRKQARADFEAALDDAQESVRQAVQWMLETVLHLVAILIGEPGVFAGLEVQVETHTNTGPLTSEEQKTVIARTEAKLLSRRSGMIVTGVRDPDAEEEQIQQESETSGATDNALLAEELRRNQNLNVGNAGSEDELEIKPNLRSNGSEQNGNPQPVRSAGVE
jgi:hypothetical protein